jgi:hypothetical protein
MIEEGKRHESFFFVLKKIQKQKKNKKQKTKNKKNPTLVVSLSIIA